MSLFNILEISIGTLIILAALGNMVLAKREMFGVTVVGSFFGLLIALTSCFALVPPQNVGIPVSMGKVKPSVESGLHFKAPWTKIVDMSAIVQNEKYNGNRAISVRLKNSSTAKADATIQWRMKVENASNLYLDYRSLDNIRDNVVHREFVETMNSVMSDFDPLNSVDTANSGTGAELSKYSDEVLKDMRDRVGDSIEVISVTIPLIHFDEATQKRVDELQSEIARTRVARQKEQTAKAEAEANRALESSLSDNVLTSKCLDIVENKGGSPLGCFPGSNQAIVDTTK